MSDQLRERTRGRRQQGGGGGGQPGTDVAQREQAAPPATMEQTIRQMQSQFEMAMPKGAEAAQLVRDALTMLRKQPNLAKCDSASVLGGLMTCAQLNLRVGVLGQAWLLPFKKNGIKHPDGSWNNDVYEAQLVIGYQGYDVLAYRSGLVASIVARTVFANDHFDIDYGTEDRLIHKPLRGKPRGEPTDYYAIIKLTTGGHIFWSMSVAEVEAHRDAYALAKKDGKIVGPWRDNFESMAWKTQVLQALRNAPKNADLAYAIAADETVRVDYSGGKEAMLYGERPMIEGAWTEEPGEEDAPGHGGHVDQYDDDPGPPEPPAPSTGQRRGNGGSRQQRGATATEDKPAEKAPPPPPDPEIARLWGRAREVSPSSWTGEQVTAEVESTVGVPAAEVTASHLRTYVSIQTGEDEPASGQGTLGGGQ